MRRTWRVWVGHPRPRAIAIAISAALATWSTNSEGASAPPVALEVLRRTPISFERNDGQFPPEVLYIARGLAGHISLRRGELCIVPGRGTPNAAEACDPASGALRIKLARANTTPEAEGREVLGTRSHHYYGPRRFENVPHYSEVRLHEVYPQIDLALHGTQGELEYDFIVAPGADPGGIALDVSSAESVHIDSSGNLVMQAGGRTLVQRAPVAYQERDGLRTPVEARFGLRDTREGREAHFVLASYDPTRALVIDPLLSYSTYLGGTAADFGGYVQVDSGGKIYVAHTTAPEGAALGGTGSNVVVTKLDPIANSVVFSTTLAGSSYDVVQGLAIGASGSGFASYITGFTGSNDFPSCFAITDCADYGGGEDAFVSVLNDVGTVVYSRYLGGSGDDAATGIALGASGSIHVVGTTTSFDFPTTLLALQHNRGGLDDDPSDAFVTKLNLGGILFSTYLGGSGADYGSAIAIGASGDVYVTGRTESDNFPRFHASQTTAPAMFVTRIGASGGSLNFSTLLGGSGDEAHAIAVDTAGATFKVYVTGDTDRSAFQQVGSSRTYAGGRDVFLARLGSSGGPLEFATLLGGSGDDYAGGLAIGSSGDIFLTGTTYTDDFPLVNQVQANPGGNSSAFVANFLGNALAFSSYVGGSGDDFGSSIVLSSRGEIYLSGRTASTIDFPTLSPYRATAQGSSDIFVSKLMFAPGPPRFPSLLIGDGQVTFSFQPPATDGGATITNYAVACNPGAITVNGSASPITVTGLTNGVLYTCTLTATNAVGTSITSSPIFVTPSVPVTLTSVASRKSHAGVGALDLTIDAGQPVSGNVTVEPRLANSTHTVVFTFSGPVIFSGNFQCVDSLGGFVPCSASASGNTVTVTLFAITTPRRVAISLTNVGFQGVNVSASVGFLPGDLNASKTVTASDILIVKGRLAPLIDPSTYLIDVDASGQIDNLDLELVKAKSGTTLP